MNKEMKKNSDVVKGVNIMKLRRHTHKLNDHESTIKKLNEIYTPTSHR
jgi:hypothetical protein